MQKEHPQWLSASVPRYMQRVAEVHAARGLIAFTWVAWFQMVFREQSVRR